MALKWNDLWSAQGRIGRRDYALWGFILFVVKHNLDRLIAWFGFGHAWYPWTYLPGWGQAPFSTGVAQQKDLLLVLATLSLPFIAVGLLLTLRRLRDMGWPLMLVVLFFVPFINLLFFALLCLQPSRPEMTAEERPLPWWGRTWITESAWGAGALSVVPSALLGFALTLFSTEYLREYGWGLFVGTPFMMGFFSALIYSLPRKRTFGACAFSALLSVLLVAIAMLGLAFEGVICLLMAAPIAIVLAIVGAFFGWLVQRDRWVSPRHQGQLYAYAWVLMPLLLIQDGKRAGPMPLVPATTSCKISAPVEKVWQHVLGFGDLLPPQEKIFQLGIAYPMRARLEGQGVGAVRYCEFSTGAFVEPITVWEENRRLGFDVLSQPHPMREWSPYANVHPAHLEGFFRSRRGEFRLTQLPDGQTLLEGTTWYEQDIWPQVYWRPWSNYLIHEIHGRVLAHIKHEAESAQK